MGDQDRANPDLAARMPAIVEEIRRELRREGRDYPGATGEALCRALTEWSHEPSAGPPLAEFREALCVRVMGVQAAAALAMMRLVGLSALGSSFIHAMLGCCTAPGRFWFAVELASLADALADADGLGICRRLLHDRSTRVRNMAIERCITCRCAKALLLDLRKIAAAEPSFGAARLGIGLLEHGFYVEHDEHDPTRKCVSVLVPGTEEKGPWWHRHSVSIERLDGLGAPEVARRLRELWSRGDLLPEGADP